MESPARQDSNTARCSSVTGLCDRTVVIDDKHWHLNGDENEHQLPLLLIFRYYLARPIAGDLAYIMLPLCTN